jgi:hypothetical protein
LIRALPLLIPLQLAAPIGEDGSGRYANSETVGCEDARYTRWMNGRKKELVERGAIIHGRAESNPLANRK